MKASALSALVNSNFSVIFDNSPDVIVVLDPETQHIVAVNQKTEELLGYSSSEMLGKPVSYFSTEPEATKTATQQKSQLPIGAVMEFKRELKKKNGDTIPMHIRSSVIEQDGVTFIISIARDDSLLQEKERMAARLQEQKDALEKLSLRDPLTGLLNRRAFEAVCETELLRFKRDFRSFCICMLDIDNFKKINDQYHHEVGDKTIVGIAGIIRTNIRDIDYACRWGGDEFIVLLPDCSSDNTLTCCERIRNAVMAFTILEHPKYIPLSVSIGIAESQQQEDILSIIRRADNALYSSKELGKNRTTFTV